MKKLTSIIVAILFTLPLFATHNKSGEIQYRQIGEKTIRCTIITYTESTSIPADRDSLELSWGDGTIEFVTRTNGNGDGEIVNNRNKFNIYVAEHTYASFGEYTLAMEDRNRSEGIVNINNGNSQDVAFYLFNTFTLSEEYNSSPQSLLPSTAVGSVTTPFEHLAAAFDEDGDVLTYQLKIPKTTGGVDVTNYQIVSDIGSNPDNQININPVTGFLIWDSPEIIGVYSISIEVTSWRNGVINGVFNRDMIIEVSDGLLPPPAVNSERLPDFGFTQQVLVGDTFRVPIIVESQGDLEQLIVSSGLFELDQKPARFEQFVDNNFEQSGEFYWVVEESHKRDEAYQVAIQADNVNMVSGFYLLRYKVVDEITTSAPILSAQDHLFKLYPNPTEDFLIIDAGNKELSQYEVYSTDGKLMTHGKVTSNKLNIKALPSGSYVLVLDRMYSLRFEKM